MVDESLIAYLNNALPDLDEELIHQLFEQDTLPEFLENNHPLCEKIAKELRAVKSLTQLVVLEHSYGNTESNGRDFRKVRC